MAGKAAITLAAGNQREKRASAAHQAGVRILAYRHDLTGKLMADGHGIVLIAGAVLINAGQIRPAHAAGTDLYQQLLTLRYRHGNFIHLKLTNLMQPGCFHHLTHGFPPLPSQR